METIDIKNKKWTDDEFYKVRKEVLATWPTGSEVDLDEAIAYHKSLPEHKVFSNKLIKPTPALGWIRVTPSFLALLSLLENTLCSGRDLW